MCIRDRLDTVFSAFSLRHWRCVWLFKCHLELFADFESRSWRFFWFCFLQNVWLCNRQAFFCYHTHSTYRGPISIILTTFGCILYTDFCRSADTKVEFCVCQLVSLQIQWFHSSRLNNTFLLNFEVLNMLKPRFKRRYQNLFR